MFEVLNSGSFAQEFWVGHDGEISIGSGFANDAVDLIAGADGYGRFCDNRSKAIKCRGYFFRSCVDMGTIRMSIAAARGCADRDENRLGCAQGGGQLRRKGETALAGVANDEIMETRFKDWDIATVQGRDPLSVLINADHVVAKIGKTSTRDKPDIAAANHCDTHQVPLSLQTRPIIRSPAYNWSVKLVASVTHVAGFAPSTWHQRRMVLGSSNRP